MSEVLDERQGVALAFMKRAGRETLTLCADIADAWADDIQRTHNRIDAVAALRTLATTYRMAGERP